MRVRITVRKLQGGEGVSVARPQGMLELVHSGAECCPSFLSFSPRVEGAAEGRVKRRRHSCRTHPAKGRHAALPGLGRSLNFARVREAPYDCEE